jgi:ribonuclease T2
MAILKPTITAQRVAAMLAAALVASSPSAAFEALDGCFAVERACPAAPTIRGTGHPGAAVLEPGRAYPLLGANRPGRAASHFQVRVPEAGGGELWVETGCGRRLQRCPEDGTAGAPPAGAAPRYVLAVNWQPAFCERNGRRPECRDQTEDRFDATHFTLHGLWPESGEYCGVPGGLRERDRPGSWGRLPAVELSPGTRRALEEAMPGTRSGLDRHEWLRHGTCYGAPAEAYFAASLRLLKALNASPVRDLFRHRIGERLTLAEIRAAFDEAFGESAGRRVGVVCESEGRERLIAELRIGLEGIIGEEAELAELMAGAPPADEHCPSGRVDPAG